MRNIWKLILVGGSAFVVLSCNSNTNRGNNNLVKEIGEFDWILGSWLRLNEEPDKTTFENWKKENPDKYIGIGYTMQNSDTIKQERMRIEKLSGEWILTVKVPEERESVIFPVTEILKEEFVCTNNSLDFPKKIKYWKSGDSMNALVAGDSLNISFEFERMN